RIANDVDGTDHGYKLHVIYGPVAAPSAKAYNTMNDTPQAITFRWEIRTTPVDAGEAPKPTATLTIDSTNVSTARLTALADAHYGTVGTDPRLPLPTEVFEMLAGDDVNEVVPTRPTQVGNSVTIPTTTGVVYRINGVEVTG